MEARSVERRREKPWEGEVYESTFPWLLEWRARTQPGRVAFRWKRYGIWRRYTWRDYYLRVAYAALALENLGLGPGDTGAFITFNRPSWVIYEVGVQLLGGRAMGIYRDSLSDEVGYLLDSGDAKFVLVEGQEQLDRVLDSGVDVDKIIVDEAKGLHQYRGMVGSKLVTFGDVMRLGRKLYSDGGDQQVKKLMGELEPDMVCGLFTTSGTTGLPKLAMISFKNMLAMAHQLNTVDPVREDWEYVSFLPTAWIGEQMMSIPYHMIGGFKVNFPETPHTLWRDFREIAPHFMFSPPRVWERIAKDIMARVDDADPIKRAAFRLAYKIGYEAARRRLVKGRSRPPTLWRALYYLAYWLALRAVLDKAGLKRIVRAYTGGAMIGEDYVIFYHSLGVNLKQIYGQTEVAGIAVVHPDDDVRPDTVGKPLPLTEVKIAEDGEILMRSPAMMKGYYKNEEATAKTIVDGWLRTGDVGVLTEDGHLKVLDRAKEIIILSDGTKVAPQVIQNKLKFSPYIGEAAIVGSGKPYLAALVNIDFEIVSRWAERRRIPFTSYSDLSQKPEVLQLLKREIEKVNRRLPEKERIRRFVSLFKEFHPDDEEMTRTRKLRRMVIESRYAGLIEAIYSGDEEYELTVTMKLEDGRRVQVTRRVKIIDVEG
ncbi:putative fatty-acid--CoA ligase [Aeropyrum pernix K1]|uniref:Fatty-acid--CoA ligase n=1 Tax=Aeropyrum pernix (strain ATCC 700893 / DSM 11879 / JCM 9820 / NBRC 100138 / K1) TaxID=272557 RepID=Q9YCF0_AERPE|nr:AMP-binding protein [Aeropyrum pernix]BAA80298.1 putative fatty-acid--CoA ligase [Aeropyrum pernix K1]